MEYFNASSFIDNIHQIKYNPNSIPPSLMLVLIHMLCTKTHCFHPRLQQNKLGSDNSCYACSVVRVGCECNLNCMFQINSELIVLHLCTYTLFCTQPHTRTHTPKQTVLADYYLTDNRKPR